MIDVVITVVAVIGLVIGVLLLLFILAEEDRDAMGDG